MWLSRQVDAARSATCRKRTRNRPERPYPSRFQQKFHDVRCLPSGHGLCLEGAVPLPGVHFYKGFVVSGVGGLRCGQHGHGGRGAANALRAQIASAKAVRGVHRRPAFQADAAGPEHLPQLQADRGPNRLRGVAVRREGRRVADRQRRAAAVGPSASLALPTAGEAGRSTACPLRSSSSLHRPRRPMWWSLPQTWPRVAAASWPWPQGAVQPLRRAHVPP
jgi:hypothetical protein